MESGKFEELVNETENFVTHMMEYIAKWASILEEEDSLNEEQEEIYKNLVRPVEDFLR